jgi:3-(3-hydroxy-phenyl)propionate hydroxylase
MKNHAVVIVGGGPTGLMLAGELALANVDVAIVERRLNQEFNGWRAGGLHSRTIEVLDQRGIAERFLSAGTKAQIAGFAWNRLDISDFPTRHNYGLALRQKHIEGILAEWVGELKVPVYRGTDVTGVAQDRDGVDLRLADGESMRAEYAVGCDGGRSFVRKALGMEFPGWDPTISHIIAEVVLKEEAAWGMRHDARGIHSLSKVEGGGTARVLATERLDADRSVEPTLRDLSEALVAEYGTDYGVHSPVSISRFTDMARQAAEYRKGRVFLAGDSAHVHYPAGGQGLNIGVQDAVNLGWKLAQVVKKESEESLLVTYHAERHPVGARVLRNSMAQVELLRSSDDRKKALYDTVAELLSMDEPRRRIAGMMSGLDVKYDFGEGHQLLGRRMPDLDLIVDGEVVRVFSLLHEGRALVINFGEAGELDIAGWAGRVKRIEARYDGKWELPVIGEVEAPQAVLIRPDGHVAWVGQVTSEGLSEALTKWSGSPAAA